MHRSSTSGRSALGSDVPEGVAIHSLQPGTTLVVNTRNSQYRVVTLFDPHSVLVKGGAMFPDETVVRFDGAADCGGALKIGWILVGCRMEMRIGFTRITSSRVLSIAIGGIPAGSGHDEHPRA